MTSRTLDLTDVPENLAAYVQAATDATSEEQRQFCEEQTRYYVEHLRTAHNPLTSSDDCVNDPTAVARFAGTVALVAQHTDSKVEAAATMYLLMAGLIDYLESARIRAMSDSFRNLIRETIGEEPERVNQPVNQKPL